jgi:putative DNA primase/helicase
VPTTRDFTRVATLALERAEVLLPRWIGGRRQGREWKGDRRANGGIGDSMTVNMATGQWFHGASGKGGGDLISLWAYLNSLDQTAAMRAVQQMIGDGDVPLLPIKREEAPCEPIPDNAPEIEPHPQYGPPSHLAKYGDRFWVTRYDYPDGKTFKQWTWRKGAWTARAYPAPRPIYRLLELTQAPSATVLIVEGEKCADLAGDMLPTIVVISWAGGAGAVAHNDWKPLDGRDVIIWPDADEPGRKACDKLIKILQPNAKRLRVVAIPTAVPGGWDIADAIAEDWTAATLLEHIAAAPEVPTPVENLPIPVPARIVTWGELGLKLDNQGKPHSHVTNCSLVLQRHPKFASRIWLDTFRMQIWHSLQGSPQAWRDADTRAVTVFCQEQLELPRVNSMMVNEALAHAAELNSRNSLHEWLESLEWDGIARLDTWLADCLGADRSPYNDAVARNWAIMMVARAYVPGCQVDTVPVLEGQMGRGKSKFLEMLAQPWFAALPMAFGEKDFFQAIQGRWLIEVPDMSGFSKREHSSILATITTRSDVYRRSYGQHVEEHLRVTIFAATSEGDEYLAESRGRRRYWPVRCQDIDLDALALQRTQIFAEALVKYRAGSTWHEMPWEEALAEQSARVSYDPWTDKVLRYAEAYYGSEAGVRITSGLILEKAIEMETARQDEQAKKRVHRILRENGWKQMHGRKDRYWIKKGDAKEQPPSSVVPFVRIG